MPAQQLFVQLLGALSGLLERVGELRTAVGALRAKLAELSKRHENEPSPRTGTQKVASLLCCFGICACCLCYRSADANPTFRVHTGGQCQFTAVQRKSRVD